MVFAPIACFARDFWQFNEKKETSEFEKKSQQVELKSALKSLPINRM